MLGVFDICVGAEPSPLISIATFNLENYQLEPTNRARAKPAAARQKVSEAIAALNPDVLALQEMGSTNDLLALRDDLRRRRIDFAYSHHVAAHDSERHVAVLSKFPFASARSHTNMSFLLRGRRLPLSRGLAEVIVQANAQYRFTLLVAHLKSKRPAAEADEAEWREQEAALLRERIDALLQENPDINLLVAGDLNDVRHSQTLKVVLGPRGKRGLLDVRPVERNDAAVRGREIAWTYFYDEEDSYTRVDYLLASRGMARELERAATYILAQPDWGAASDHRPIVAAFFAADR